MNFYSFYFLIIQVILNLTSCIDHDITQNTFACIVCNYTTEGDQVDADNDSTSRGSKVLEVRGHMLRIFMAFLRPCITRTTSPQSTILPSRDTRAGDGNVATIVQLASRRGIISAHCHRLIEFGTDRITHVDRPSVSVNAMHVQHRCKQKGTGVFNPIDGRAVNAFVKGRLDTRFECLCC